MSSKYEYQDVGIDDHGNSSTDVEDSVGEEKNWSRQPRKTLARRILGVVRATWRMVNTLLLLAILGLLLEPQWRTFKNRYEFGGDLTGFVPHFSQQITTFKPDLSFVPENSAEFWGDEVQQRWLSIVPRGLGYIHVDNPSDYDNLPTPIHDYTNMTVFTTAMPHQLHCLYNILEVYYALVGANPRHVPTEMTFHLQHCFEYLRLSIMCAGDVTLEGAETTFPKGFGGSDGWDAKHVCKNYGQIFDFLDENRASDRKWIGI